MTHDRSLSIVDAHAHLGRWPYPIRQGTAADLAAEMQALGVVASVTSHSLAIYYDAVEGNAALAAEIRDFPQIWGYVSVNLNYPEQAEGELERYLGGGSPFRHKFIGVKVHQSLSRRRFDTPEAMAIARAVDRYRVPVLVHTFGSALESPWNVLPAAKANPDVPFILGHMGGEAWSEGARVGREAPNLYLELCSSWTDPEKVRAAIDAVGPERVLFGTDANLFTLAHMVGALEDAGLSGDELRLVMGGNARRLFPDVARTLGEE